ncbi:hypothetical protein [Nonomuraea sp. JJY05]|jgi:hypothetical protein|uniref:hypothetical protein n=1 Tax=Nonomuraea sp. JJY05 TaxID=3350255 RepID=UPI00373EF7EB
MAAIDSHVSSLSDSDKAGSHAATRRSTIYLSRLAVDDGVLCAACDAFIAAERPADRCNPRHSERCQASSSQLTVKSIKVNGSAGRAGACASFLAFGGLLLPCGRMADLLGRRRIFLIGVALLGGRQPGLRTRAGAVTARDRAVRAGPGRCDGQPWRDVDDHIAVSGPEERAKALGIWGGIAALGGTSGLVLSGALTDLVFRRGIFLINIAGLLLLSGVAAGNSHAAHVLPGYEHPADRAPTGAAPSPTPARFRLTCHDRDRAPPPLIIHNMQGAVGGTQWTSNENAPPWRGTGLGGPHPACRRDPWPGEAVAGPA